MPVASSNPRRKTCFPNITAVADTLGVRRETLYRALCGKTFNPELAGRYAAIVLPPLLAKLSGGTLPVGARIEGGGPALAQALGHRVSRDGAALVLLTEFALAPLTFDSPAPNDAEQVKPLAPGAAPLPRKRRKARPLAGAGKEEG